LSEEIRAWRRGYRHVAGLDEAGRGPMAGPVVAAAVILDPQGLQPWMSEIRDSKVLQAPQRERLAELLRATVAHGIGSAGHDEIDAHGLVPATRLAMLRALEAMPQKPDLLLVDAMWLPDMVAGETGPATQFWSQEAIVHGDGISASVAAASIIAKVERDRVMDDLDARYPQYGFGHNRGYCTSDHLRALDEHGPCPVHRRSFAPVRDYLEKNRQGDTPTA
jgi:ribonuclease HII